MNILQLQNALKNLSDQQLSQELKSPTGQAPAFLVLSELSRRERMRQSSAQDQAKGQDQSTVADQAIAAAGVPQGPLPAMARTLAPNTAQAQNSGIQKMAKGGAVKKMAVGDVVVKGGIQYIEQPGGQLTPVGDLPTTSNGIAVWGGGAPAVGATGYAYGRNQFGPPQSGLSSVGQWFGDMSAGMSRDQYNMLAAQNADLMQKQALGLSTNMVGRGQPSIKASAGTGTGAGNSGMGGAFFQPAQNVPVQGMGPAVQPAPAAPPFDTTGLIYDPYTGEWLQPPEDASKGYAQPVMPPGAQGPAGAPVPDAAPSATPSDPSAAPAVAPPGVMSAPAAVVSGGAGGGGGAATGAVNSGVTSDYQKALQDALAEVEKRANQDKWLAIAMAGLQTLGATGVNGWQAIGQGNAAGLGMYMKSRDDALQNRLAILDAMNKDQLTRQQMAMRGSGGGGAGSGRIDGLTQAQSISLIKDDIKALQAQKNALVQPGVAPSSQDASTIQSIDAQIAQKQAILSGIAPTLYGSLSAPIAAPVVGQWDVTQ